MNYRLLIAAIMLILAIAGFLILNDNLYSTKDITNDNLKIIRVGYNPATTSVTMFIGIDKGFFEEEGIKIIPTVYPEAKYVIQSLLRNDIDISVGTPISATTLNAFERDVPLYVVAGGSQGLPYLIIRKDLWDSGEIRKISDLKGKRIQVSSKGSSSYFGIAYVFKKENLDIEKDVDLVFLGQNEAIAAIESKSIDAATIRPPYLTSVISEGKGVLFPEIKKYFTSENGYQRAVIFASGNFIKEKPELLKAFLRAYVKSIKIYNDAYEHKEPSRYYVVKIMSNITGIDEGTVEKDEWFYQDPEGKPDMDSIKEIYNYYLETGGLEKEINLNEFINLSFLPG